MYIAIHYIILILNNKLIRPNPAYNIVHIFLNFVKQLTVIIAFQLGKD